MVLVMTLTDKEQARTLSLLTDQPHMITVDKKKYVAFKGYVFTYSTFSAVFMWAICGQSLYSKIWSDQENSVSTVKELNLHDKHLQTLEDIKVGYYLAGKIRESMSKLSPADVESAIVTMLTEVV